MFFCRPCLCSQPGTKVPYGYPSAQVLIRLLFNIIVLALTLIEQNMKLKRIVQKGGGAMAFGLRAHEERLAGPYSSVELNFTQLAPNHNQGYYLPWVVDYFWPCIPLPGGEGRRETPVVSRAWRRYPDPAQGPM